MSEELAPTEDPNDPNYGLSAEELADRRDASLPKGFQAWLRRERERDEYTELAGLICDKRTEDGETCFDGMRFVSHDFDLYVEELDRIERLDQVDNLLQASNEWRAEAAAKKNARMYLGVHEASTAVSAKKGVVAEMPVPVVECGFQDPKTRAKCHDASMPGSLRCRRHGGDWLDPRIRQSLLMAAYMKLVEASEVAVDTLIWVAVNGKREDARVMAAKEILDRAGIRAGVDVKVTTDASTAGDETMKEIMARLDVMADGIKSRDALLEERNAADALAAAAAEAEIVDAEIIDEVDDLEADVAMESAPEPVLVEGVDYERVIPNV